MKLDQVTDRIMETLFPAAHQIDPEFKAVDSVATAAYKTLLREQIFSILLEELD